MRGDGRIIEPDDRKIARHVDAALARRVQHTRRHLVIAREYGRRSWIGIEQAYRGGEAGFERVIAARDEVRPRIEAMSRNAVMIAEHAFARRTETFRSCDEADALVPKLGKIGHGTGDGLTVVRLDEMHFVIKLRRAHAHIIAP